MLNSYLRKRPKSQYWQLRMMVPLSARRVVGKREFTKTLGVTDRRRAEELALPTLLAWKAKVDAAMSTGTVQNSEVDIFPPTQAELSDVALIVGYERASQRAAELVKTKARLGEAHYRALRNELERRHTDAVRLLKGEDFSFWRERALHQVLLRRWDLPTDGSLFDDFVKQLARAGTDAFAKALAIMDDDEDTFAPSPSTRDALKKKSERAQDGEQIMQLYSVYETQRLAEGKKRSDTLLQDRKPVLEFAEFLGMQRSLRSVEPSDVREWRNLQTSLPVVYGKLKEFRGMPLRQIASHAKEKGLKTLDLVTVNKKLSAISALFSWAKREGYVEANPVNGLFYQVDKQKNSRPPFTAEQLNRILQSPLFTGFFRDGKEFQTGNIRTRDWRFWLPLLCLFTGARLGEIAQLRLEDVQQEGEIHYIEIRNDPKKGQATKSGYDRIAPLHSTLLRIGFLHYVTSQRNRAVADGDHRLFPELERNERAQNGKASRFWRTYLERINLKIGADGFGAHSFRHGVADQLRRAGYFDQDIGVVLGHSHKTVTSAYGQMKQGTLSKLAEMIEDMRFVDVDFAHLISLGNDDIASPEYPSCPMSNHCKN